MGYKFQYGVSYAQERPVTAPLPLCGPIGDVLRFGREIGLDGIEIHGREYEFSEEKIEEIRSCCAENQMKIAAVVTGRLYNQTTLSLAEPDPVKRAWVIEQMKRYIDTAQKFETDVVIGWVKGRFAVDNPPSLYFKLLTESMRELDAYAGERQVRLVVEVINRYEVDCFITVRETLEFIERNGLEHTYLHLDTFHMNIEETDMCGAIRLAGKKLGYVHVADNTRLAPGTGTLDFKAILETLNEIGYTGFVTVECLPQPSGREAAKAAVDYLRAVAEA